VKSLIEQQILRFRYLTPELIERMIDLKPLQLLLLRLLNQLP
jgi:hypothetical protein